jgi:hypothetical protein
VAPQGLIPRSGTGPGSKGSGPFTLGVMSDEKEEIERRMDEIRANTDGGNMRKSFSAVSVFYFSCFSKSLSQRHGLRKGC